MKVSTILFIVMALIAFICVNATSFKQIAHLRSDMGGAKEYVLALCRCRGSSIWTLHGLWPTAMFCTKEKFSTKAIEPIRREMENHWPACPEFGNTNEWLWTHEWEKHGVCARINGKNATQIQYFSTGMDLLEKYHHLCSPDLTGECRLNLDKDFNVL